jgi:hypothetical protein
VAVTTMIKTRSLLSHAELKLDRHDRLKRAFARNFGRNRWADRAKPCQRNALADALVEARVDVLGKARVCAEARGSSK